MAEPDPHLKLTVVLQTANTVLLDLAQAALNDAGINFTLSAPTSPEFGFTPILNPVRKVLVAEPDAPRAHQIIEELELSPESDEGE